MHYNDLKFHTILNFNFFFFPYILALQSYFSTKVNVIFQSWQSKYRIIISSKEWQCSEILWTTRLSFFDSLLFFDKYIFWIFLSRSCNSSLASNPSFITVYAWNNCLLDYYLSSYLFIHSFTYFLICLFIAYFVWFISHNAVLLCLSACFARFPYSLYLGMYKTLNSLFSFFDFSIFFHHVVGRKKRWEKDVYKRNK